MHSLATIAVILCPYTDTKNLRFLMQTHKQTGVYVPD